MQPSHLCLIGLLSMTQAMQTVSFFEVVLEEWDTYKLTHSKAYESHMEEKFRMKIFMENKAKIERHNALVAKGLKSYHLKMNKYGDLLHHEFVAHMNGFMRSSSNKTKLIGATYLLPAHVDSLPKDVDWRKHGAVTDVKDQGRCGSCWSFSTTGALEGQNFRKTGILTSLSEQNLIDCSTSYGNQGCNGGLMDQAFDYIKENDGIDTEKSYPYEAVDDNCRYNPKNKGASDVGFSDIPEGDERALKHAIATVGPVSVAIDASQVHFQFYSHGVYRHEDCDASNIDHAVLAVGYGVDKKSGSAYWLVKNSWGKTWGDHGYIKIARNEDNMCGIATAASYPIV